jgi:hypothetical protein
MLDNFEDLTTLEPNRQKSTSLFSKSLVRGRRGTIVQENLLLIFETAWSNCFEEIYPMEIQVLKETNEENFSEFITNMIHN